MTWHIPSSAFLALIAWPVGSGKTDAILAALGQAAFFGCLVAVMVAVVLASSRTAKPLLAATRTAGARRMTRRANARHL